MEPVDITNPTTTTFHPFQQGLSGHCLRVATPTAREHIGRYCSVHNKEEVTNRKIHGRTGPYHHTGASDPLSVNSEVVPSTFFYCSISRLFALSFLIWSLIFSLFPLLP